VDIPFGDGIYKIVGGYVNIVAILVLVDIPFGDALVLSHNIVNGSSQSLF